MTKKKFRGIPKILKINYLDDKKMIISVLFNNSENRILDFQDILLNQWKVKKTDPEYLLWKTEVFSSVALNGNTLMWKEIPVYITLLNGERTRVPFDVGADTLYGLSQPDLERNTSIGNLLKKWRKEMNLTQEEVAKNAGTSRSYITKLENGTQDIELNTLYKIVEAGLGKSLKLSIE